MKEFNELLKELNDLQLTQTEIDWAECIPNDIWIKHFANNFTQLTTDLDVDRRRHYETCTTVIKIYDRFLGIRHINNVYSESSDVEDCFHTLTFKEMQEIQTVTYI